MVTYDTTDKTLFSADAFGTFGAMNGNLFADEVNFERDWLDDARRYYTNIVGKYGPSVQTLLKKASACLLYTSITSSSNLANADVMLAYDSSALEFVSGTNADGGAGAVRVHGDGGTPGTCLLYTSRCV